MQLLVATLCDTAVENQGKLNVLGAFDAIVAQNFPAGFSFTLVLRFCFTSEDHGAHRFSVSLVDETETSPQAPTENQLEVNMPAGTAGFSTQNMIQPLQGSVSKPGTYHFDVRLDGNTLARIPLRVLNQSEMNPPANA